MGPVAANLPLVSSQLFCFPKSLDFPQNWLLGGSTVGQHPEGFSFGFPQSMTKPSLLLAARTWGLTALCSGHPY